MASHADQGAGEEEEVRNSQKGSRKRRKVDKGDASAWGINPDGSIAVTQTAGDLLSQVLGVFARKHREVLEKIIARQAVATAASAVGSDTQALVAQLHQQSNFLKQCELEHMLGLVQLVLNIDSEQQNAAVKYLPNITIASMAKKYNTAEQTFRDWIKAGHRLLMLCAAGGLAMLSIIAAMDLRTYITRTCLEQDIYAFASALREVKVGKWLPMVRRLMLPIHYLNNLEGYTTTLQLLYDVPFKIGGTPETRVLTFKDMSALDEIYKGVQTNYPILPERSPEWHKVPTRSWKPLEDPNTYVFPSPITISTDLDVSQTPNPVTPDNRDSFTDAQRELAEEAEIATSLDDLKEKLADLHEGGVSQPGSYVEISSDILGGQTLHITGAEGKLVALFFEIPEQYRQALADAIEHIHAAMPGEFKDDNCRREAFQYFSCHYTWYARYAEKGKGAPAGVHPNKLHKKGAARVNLSQRVPHLAKDILDHPQEYALLAEAFSDFFEILRVALAQYLPEDTAELSIYCESLPLHASSPCYPFGGFVINLQACTWAHRDGFDKRLCVVAPFDTFEGGQLCLYEAGLSFNLRMGDVLRDSSPSF
ncbi:hypothetical protein B0H14DRAFT_3874122 [Mycena olivaceomarginata]|nr:hypothetical protein B0H14DRAFT_3874122 [Mycena olivaceomarginata]